MKWSIEKNRYLTSEQYIGKKKGYKCKVIYNRVYKYWYYLIHKNDQTFSYNSVWDNINFQTQEECEISCENYVDEIIKKEKMK